MKLNKSCLDSLWGPLKLNFWKQFRVNLNTFKAHFFETIQSKSEYPFLMELPEHLELQRRVVVSSGEQNYHVNTVTGANIYRSIDVDNSWSEDQWKKVFQVIVTDEEKDRHRAKDKGSDDLEFDLVNIDPAIANALRRILISEVPTVAIEHVFYVNNTSIIADEVLAHRLGLIPLNIDPEKLKFKGEDAANETNTVVFKLNVECQRFGDNEVSNKKVFASALQWLPEGSEMPEETSCRFSQSQSTAFAIPPRAVQDDILLAKMAPRQTIDLEAHAIKGIGAEHAKWSPVATAWYRLLPEVVVTQHIADEDAVFLSEQFPGLLVLDKSKRGKTYIKAGNARGHEKYLEKLRHLITEERFKDRIRLQRRKEHFIFNIEAVGALSPETLFCQALDILSQKCDRLLARLQQN